MEKAADKRGISVGSHIAVFQPRSIVDSGPLRVGGLTPSESSSTIRMMGHPEQTSQGSNETGIPI